jgi:hypothetical protein
MNHTTNMQCQTVSSFNYGAESHKVVAVYIVKQTSDVGTSHY